MTGACGRTETGSQVESDGSQSETKDRVRHGMTGASGRTETVLQAGIGRIAIRNRG